MQNLSPAQKRKRTLSDRDTLRSLVERMEDYDQAFAAADAKARRDRDYYDGHQLTANELSQLALRKQPPVIDNKIKDKIDSMIGMELATRRDPKAFPRNQGGDENTAEVITDALRFVADNTDLDKRYSSCAKDFFIEGTTGAACEVRRVSALEYEIEIKRLAWDRIAFDPHSRELDFSDSSWFAVGRWVDKSTLESQYGALGKQAYRESNTDPHGISGRKWEDSPRYWTDKERNRVMAVSMYYQDGGKWTFCKFVLGGFLLRPETSVYLDDEKKPRCPWKFQSAHIDQHGYRYGIVRRYIHLQDEINKRRSKALHLLNVNQIVAGENAVQNKQRARSEANKPDGYIEYDPNVPFEIRNNADLGMSQVGLLQQTLNQFEAVGPNAALTGADGASSGRSLQIQQQAGVMNVGGTLDLLRDFKKSIYKQMALNIKQFWTEERWIRVRDKETKFMQINQRVSQAEYLQTPQGQKWLQDQIDENPGITATDIKKALPERPVLNDVAQIDVDLILEEAPDYVNMQEEFFTSLVRLGAEAGVQFPPEVYVEAAPVRNKDRLMELLNPSEPSEQQQQAIQLAQQGQKIETRKTLAEIADRQASAQKKAAEAQGAQLENMAAAAVLGVR